MKNWYIIILLVVLLYSCKEEKKVMTPTDFTNIILKSVFEKDSPAFKERLYHANELQDAINLAKLTPEVRKNEQKIINDKYHYIVYEDSCMLEYRSLIKQFDSLGITAFTMDTVDFNNYFEPKRPYIRLEADSWIYKGQDTFVLKIKDAVLLRDGWNLGSVKLMKGSMTDPKFLRVSDILRKIPVQDSTKINQ